MKHLLDILGGGLIGIAVGLALREPFWLTVVVSVLLIVGVQVLIEAHVQKHHQTR